MSAPTPSPSSATSVSSQPSADTLRVIGWLENGTETQRQTVEHVLTDSALSIDQQAIRAVVVKLLKTRYRAAEQPQDDDAEALRVANTRAWLLYVLPLLAAGDSECEALLQAAVDHSIELNMWCRYWCMAGQYRARWAGLAALLPKVIEHDKQDLVVMLAHAIRAQYDDHSLDKLRAGLDEKANDVRRWGTLRALRIVPIEDGKLIQSLSRIVDRGSNSDLTYDAIWALSTVSPESEYARLAGRTLGNFIDRWKTYPGRDAMRLKALKALARLRRLSESQILIEQFLDDNPAIVREAACALESMIGTRAAVDRVLSQAALTTDGKVEPYGVALRWMQARNDVVDQLATVMAAGSAEERDLARLLLSEVGGTAAIERLRVQSTLMSQHTKFLGESEERVQNLFEQSISDAKAGFQKTLLMDQVLFYAGLVLIGASAVLMLYRHGALSADWVGTGTTGVLSVLYTLFFSKPRQQVQASVDHLMNLKIVFLGFLRQLHQADSAYVRRLLDDKQVASEETKGFNDLIEQAMLKATQRLQPRNGAKQPTI